MVDRDVNSVLLVISKKNSNARYLTYEEQTLVECTLGCSSISSIATPETLQSTRTLLSGIRRLSVTGLGVSSGFQIQLLPPDVTPGMGRLGPQMKKFEQVSSGHHQMSPEGKWEYITVISGFWHLYG